MKHFLTKQETVRLGVWLLKQETLTGGWLTIAQEASEQLGFFVSAVNIRSLAGSLGLSIEKREVHPRVRYIELVRRVEALERRLDQLIESIGG